MTTTFMSSPLLSLTSESVTEGHPDKMCDQISDAVLDAILKDDPLGRVACETACTTGLVAVIGEITTSTYVDIPAIVRETVRDIGYNNQHYGFDWETCAVLTAIEKQSPDIAMGVDASTNHEQGAGDQGMMFGYACDETKELMPLPITLAHKLCRRLAEVRKKGILPFVRPDGKSQVTVRYENDRPVAVENVVVSTQHAPDVKHKALREAVVEGEGPHRAQALFSGARAREAAGDTVGAAAWRRELAERYAGTPWAERLESAGREGR